MDESQFTVFQCPIFRTENAFLAICPTDYQTAGVLVDDVCVLVVTVWVTTHALVISPGVT